MTSYQGTRHVKEYAILVLFLALTSSQCQTFTKEQEKQIMDIIEHTMDCHNIPGLAISVVKGSSSWRKGFGTADINTDRPVETSTLFASGSLGKAFTMTLLAMLLNGTSYTWSTKLIDIEGVDITFISENLTREVTLADMLSHNTGLSEIVDYGFIAGYPEGTTKECLTSRLKYLPQKYDHQGDFFQYNNMMYMVLGHVIETLGNDTWENLMTSRIFKPLGMTSSKIMSCDDDVLTGNVAKPYIMPNDKLEDGTPRLYKITPLEPAGAILSSADDMANWLEFNLRHGTTPDGHILVDPDLFAEAFENYSNVDRGNGRRRPQFPVDDITSGYGYAWFTSSYRGFDRCWHSGGLFSYISEIWLFFEQDLGIFISLNGPGLREGPRETIHVILAFVSDIALGLEPWLNTSTACSYPAPWQTKTSFNFSGFPEHSNNHMRDFLGTFGNPLLPDITIRLKGHAGDMSKKLQLHWNRIKGDLLPTPSLDKFNFQLTHPWEFVEDTMLYGTIPLLLPVSFNRDSEGQVQSFYFTFDNTARMLFQHNVTFINDCELSRSACEIGRMNTSNAGSTASSCLFIVIFSLIGV